MDPQNTRETEGKEASNQLELTAASPQNHVGAASRVGSDKVKNGDNQEQSSELASSEQDEDYVELQNLGDYKFSSWGNRESDNFCICDSLEIESNSSITTELDSGELATGTDDENDGLNHRGSHATDSPQDDKREYNHMAKNRNNNNLENVKSRGQEEAEAVECFENDEWEYSVTVSCSSGESESNEC
uniref:Uncharacterized protein n=1 Tax=Trichuris muris TaxID=70415 RepID=A0A5S6R4K4_TRIMR